VIAALLSAGVALLVAHVVSGVWDRPRPYVAHPGEAHLFISPSNDPSFPSDHATAAFAIAAAIWLRHRGVGAAALVASPAALVVASYGRNGGLAEWARPISPISTVPPGIAQAVRWLRTNVRANDVLLLDSAWHYLDIPLAFASGLPDERIDRLRWPDFVERIARTPPTLALLLYQGTLRDTKGAEGASEDSESFAFRGMRFCRVEKFVYASIYRRCDSAPAAAR
jgi:hypothetical protein